MNATFNVASITDCDEILNCKPTQKMFDPIWRQTDTGCRILLLLQDLYGFSISYVLDNTLRNITVIGKEKLIISKYGNASIDIYLRPMSFGLHNFQRLYPVCDALKWRFGFVLRQESSGSYKFYSKPFSLPLWNGLYIMAGIISILFYFLKKWEFGVLGGWETSYTNEILMVIGAYCQHVPPIDATLPSRRIAYFIFLMFAYIIYTFYTSNLLSHLVNDTNLDLTLESLAASDIELVIVDYMKLILKNFPSDRYNYSIIVDKLRNLRSVTILEGIKGVKTGKMALLSDYISLYPYAKSLSARKTLCELYTIDLFSKIQKYFFVSKTFPYKEQFKIGTLRAKEAGLLKRPNLLLVEVPKCESSTLVHTTLTQISVPLLILTITYVVSLLLLLLERLHYKKNKVWPYVN